MAMVATVRPAAPQFVVVAGLLALAASLGVRAKGVGNSSSLPNIVFMLTDDLGFNSAWNNPEQITPTLDKLPSEGVKLEQFYVFKYCSPTRGSFLTGRLPYHLRAVQSNFIPWSMPEGLDLRYTILPEQLKSAGYATHHVGKWHQGFFKPEYIPINRGFDTSFGFLCGGEDHFTQQANDGSHCTSHIYDLFENDHPAFGKNGSGLNDTIHYNGYTFTQHAVDLIKAHDPTSKPMFLYYALHNTHWPVEAPARFTNMYTFNQTMRNAFNGMCSVVDESVKNVTDALKAAGMWENTVFVWTTDNGAPVNKAGSNKPLKGGKGTNWEGGVRVPAVVSGGLVPAERHGSVAPGFAHICDFYRTFAKLAGLSGDDPRGPTPVEGLDLWPWILGTTTTSPRTEFVHDFRMTKNGGVGAIRIDKHKLIVGPEHEASWFGQFSPNATTRPALGASECSLRKPCLYDLSIDPTEHHDISSEKPHVVQIMMRAWQDVNNTYLPPPNPKSLPTEFCSFVAGHGQFIQPWFKEAKHFQ